MKVLRKLFDRFKKIDISVIQQTETVQLPQVDTAQQSQSETEQEQTKDSTEQVTLARLVVTEETYRFQVSPRESLRLPSQFRLGEPSYRFRRLFLEYDLPQTSVILLVQTVSFRQNEGPGLPFEESHDGDIRCCCVSRVRTVDGGGIGEGYHTEDEQTHIHRKVSEYISESSLKAHIIVCEPKYEEYVVSALRTANIPFQRARMPVPIHVQSRLLSEADFEANHLSNYE